MESRVRLSRALLLGLALVALGAPAGRPLPALVARATDSLASLLGRQGQQQQQQQLQPNAELAAPANASATLQALGQRNMGQLNGLLLGQPAASQLANLTQSGAKYTSQVLEALSNVGKAIQQQISAAGQVQIVAAGGEQQLGNARKNEYQPLEQQAAGANSSQAALGQREQGEALRQEIVRRAGQLQQVVASSMEALKSNGDLIVRRLLEQLNARLDLAKSKADKIINEPATNEVGLKALAAINQGLNNLNNIITNIVTRLELSKSEQQQAGLGSQRLASSLLQLEPSRLKLNLHQIGQHFSSALNAAQQQQQQLQQRHSLPAAAAAASAPNRN